MGKKTNWCINLIQAKGFQRDIHLYKHEESRLYKKSARKIGFRVGSFIWDKITYFHSLSVGYKHNSCANWLIRGQGTKTNYPLETIRWLHPTESYA